MIVVQFIIGLGLKLIKLFAPVWLGIQWARRRRVEKVARIKDDQLEAALDRPRDRDDLVDRLRSRGL